MSHGASARLILVTGKGGVGKTTMAAATARRCAASGLRTCVASTDMAHSLGDVLDVELSSTPTLVGDLLTAVHIDAHEQMRESWGQLQGYLRGLVKRAGLSDVQTEELAVVPGLDDVLTLAAVVELADTGDHDVVVVDCAPSAETIRLLSLPHVMGWWLEKLLPSLPDMGPLVPFIENGLGIPVPGSDAFAAGKVLLDRLREAERVLNDPQRTLVRLVTTPEHVVVSETRRTATYLSLFGYRVDAVIANRVLPRQADAFWAAWRADQEVQLGRLRTDLAPVPVLETEVFDRPVVGLDALGALGEALHPDDDPTASLTHEPTIR
ncbi:MAG: ArsA family ATPase, partial [Actinomycetota bacterium]|nr:ArsA family ATPase [Actinomycetota bacterium]